MKNDAHRLPLILPGIVLLCCAVLFAFSAAEPDELAALVHHRDAQGNIIVVGTNSVESAHLMRWVETVKARVEEYTALPLAFDGWLLQVVCVPAYVDRIGVRRLSSAYGAARRLQILDLPGYDNSDIIKAENALCGLLLEGYLLERCAADIVPEYYRSIPEWFAPGLAGCLSLQRRQRALGQTLHLWRNGRLPSLISFFESPDEYPVDITITVFQWWSSIPDRAGRFAAFFELLCKGRSPAIEDYAMLSGYDVKTLDEEWDFWLQRNSKHTITPAVQLSMAVINRLRAALLLNASDFDNYKHSSVFDGSDLAALIPFSGVPWAVVVADRKAAMLQMLQAGQDADFVECIKAYEAFLDLLRAGAAEDVLFEQWETAEAMLDYLVFRMRAGR